MKANYLAAMVIPLLLTLPASAQSDNQPATYQQAAQPELVTASLRSPANHSTPGTTEAPQINSGENDGDTIREENTTPLSATLALIAAGLFGTALLGRRPSTKRH